MLIIFKSNCRKVKEYIAKKKKVEVKPATIKEQITLFLKCDIVVTDSQTKDYIGDSANFGSSCTVSDSFIDKVAKLGIMDTACELTSVKDNKTAKKTDGTKSRAVRGIPKLVDANGAHQNRRNDHYFVRGRSAVGIISGLSKDDRNIIGVYPMKGKMFNVRGEAMKRISENKEFVEIKDLVSKPTNNTVHSKRSTLHCATENFFMTDQDLDGSHIKGLGINMFDTLWDSLIKLNIIGFMNTPILKAKKGNMELLFYNDGEYNAWKSATPGYDKWNIKYYKGLGTSTSKEFKEYFKEQKIVMFNFDDTSKNSIDMVFNKKRADDHRHGWVNTIATIVSTLINRLLHLPISYIEKKHFSKYDCERSIPNLMDGLKISQRKILFAAFKRISLQKLRLHNSAVMFEHSGYHHGEASLNGYYHGAKLRWI